MAAALEAMIASEVPHLDEVPEALTVPAVTAPPPPPRRFQVVGHRGNGMNPLPSPSADPRLTAVKENSILSFNEAGRFPVDFVEFDVQVTADGHAVIFHDISILAKDDESGNLSEKKVTDLSLEDFLSYGPQQESTKAGKAMLRRSREGGVFDWAVDADAPLCTLEEAFDRVDPHLGFNIELKFDDNLIYKDEELTCALRIIWEVVFDRAGDRPIIFSSFHPDAARLIRKIQGMYPVFFLTEAGTEIYADPRMNSLEAAIEVCLESGLQGIVSEVRGVFRDPSMIARLKEADLRIFTYGELNNVGEAVYVQYLMGIDGVIVDLVREITEAVSDLIGCQEEGRDECLEEELRPRISQLELPFLLKLIPQLVQRA